MSEVSRVSWIACAAELAPGDALAVRLAGAPSSAAVTRYATALAFEIIARHPERAYSVRAHRTAPALVIRRLADRSSTNLHSPLVSSGRTPLAGTLPLTGTCPAILSSGAPGDWP